MTSFSRLRVYHAALAILAISAYLSDDLEDIHAWLGYGVAALLGLRVLSLAVPRLLPRAAWIVHKADHQPEHGLRNPIVSKVFILGIMACLVVTVSTGIVMRQTVPPNTADLSFVQTAQADDHGRKRTRSAGRRLLKGVHELSANGMLGLVGLHVGYLFLFRRSMATRMILVR